MSLRARRLAGSVATDRFQWQRTADAAEPLPVRPVALVFAESQDIARAATEPHQPIEAREIQLPSVSEERLSTIERHAFAEGYAAGERKGEADATAQLDSTLARLSTTIDEIGGLRVGVMRRAERELIHLALAMAGRIVRRELDIDPDLLLVIARIAVDRLGERAVAVVHLNPADMRALSTSKSPEFGTLDLIEDATVPRGGCRIESACGEIDAGIDAQIRELSRELLFGDRSEESANGVLFNG